MGLVKECLRHSSAMVTLINGPVFLFQLIMRLSGVLSPRSGSKPKWNVLNIVKGRDELRKWWFHWLFSYPSGLMTCLPEISVGGCLYKDA